MTSFSRLLIALAATLGFASAQAACDYPKGDINIPDGKSATQEQMLAARSALQEYNAKVQEYLDCLDAEERALGDAVTEEQKGVHAAKHNAAVEAMELQAARFNDQLKTFNAKKK